MPQAVTDKFFDLYKFRINNRYEKRSRESNVNV